MSFEGGELQVSDYLSVGVAGRPATTLKLDQGVQCNVSNTIYIGSSNGATGELVNVNGVLRSAGSGTSLYVGQNGYGVMTLNGGSTHIAAATFIGAGSTSVSHLTVTGGSNTFGDVSQEVTFTVGLYGKGSLLAVGGTNTVGGSGVLGAEAGGACEMTLTNGLWTIGRFLYIGRSGSGTLNINGGEMRFVNASDPLLVVARYSGSTGTVNVSEGVLDVNGRIWLGSDVSTLGRLTLSGNGMLRVKTIMEYNSDATSQVLFDGGTLKAVATGTLIELLDDVRLTANGMVVDTDGCTVSVVPMLQNAEGEAGGITKKGKGTLTLTGTRAATGPVSVLDGTLAVNENVKVYAGISRIDGVLSLTSDKRLIVEAGAALAGTGSVARVTLADNAVLARSKTDNAIAPLNISDCVANGHLTVALSGYALNDLLASLPLLKVSTSAFVKPASMSVTLDGESVPSIILRYTEIGDATILNAKYNSGTLIIVH
jgi:T5SS/PEP-CTERM-associated repeat protein/autotransporter-associated beta strand protein